MKFLLIDSQGYFSFYSSKKITSLATSLSPPLGLLYIGRALEDEGHKVEVIQFLNRKSPKEQIKKSLKSVDVVGINISSSFINDTIQIAKTIKEFDSSITIILGGPHCIFHPKRALEDIPIADMSLEGEGDFAIKDIAKAIESKKTLSEVKGLFYRENGKIKAGKPHQIIMGLDSIPFPARHLVEKYDYGKTKNTYLFKPKLTSMVSSRGCPFHCRFCARNAPSYRIYRQRSAENVVKEIIEIENKYKSVYIVDDNFLSDKKRTHKIMDELIKNGTNIDLLVRGARVDSAERELYEKMKKAGVKYIEFGIESGNQGVLDFYNKRTTLNQIRKAVKLSRQMNFITTGNFILGAPIESKKHFKKTIKFASSLPLDIAFFFPLTYMYGSDLWDEAVQNGNIKGTDSFSVCADSRIGLGNFTEEELENVCKKAFRSFYLRPSYVVPQVLRSIFRKNFGVLKIGMNYV